MTQIVLQVKQQFSPTGRIVCNKNGRKLEWDTDGRGERESSEKCFVPSDVICKYLLNSSDNNWVICWVM